jgi:hypothetical protein
MPTTTTPAGIHHEKINASLQGANCQEGSHYCEKGSKCQENSVACPSNTFNHAKTNPPNLSTDVPRTTSFHTSQNFKHGNDHNTAPCPKGTFYSDRKNICVNKSVIDGHSAHNGVHSLAQYDHSDLNPTGCTSQLHPVDQKYVRVGVAVSEVRSCDVKIPFPTGHSATESEFNTSWLGAADFGTQGTHIINVDAATAGDIGNPDVFNAAASLYKDGLTGKQSTQYGYTGGDISDAAARAKYTT